MTVTKHGEYIHDIFIYKCRMEEGGGWRGGRDFGA